MRYVPAFLLDAVLVLIFAAIGRASHDESPAGFLITAWPFLVALLVGHALAALLPPRPRRPWSLPWGTVAWAVTVLGGMLLRVVAGDTAQVPFIVVATIVLAVFLLGWRALALLLRRRRATRTEAAVEADVVPGDAATGDAAAVDAAAREVATGDAAARGDAAGEAVADDATTRDAAAGDAVAEDAVADAEAGLDGMADAIDDADRDRPERGA